MSRRIPFIANLFPHSHTECEMFKKQAKKEHLTNYCKSVCIYVCLHIHKLHAIFVHILVCAYSYIRIHVCTNIYAQRVLPELIVR